jgi:hypothetical protein
MKLNKNKSGLDLGVFVCDLCCLLMYLSHGSVQE